MSLPDATASAQLDERVVKPVYLAYLDFATDPVLANSSGKDITPTGTGITKLDGNTFIGIDGHFIDLSPVQHGSAGSKSITAKLSGIPGDAVDDDTLAVLDDASQWRGRAADVWQIIRDASNTQQGAVRIWCSGRIVAMDQGGDDKGLIITVTIEGYLASLRGPSNRTYMDQELVDPGDLSAKAAIAAANGSYNKAIVPQAGYNSGIDYFNYGGGFPW